MVKGPTIFGVEELRWLARSVVSAQDRVRHPATPLKNRAQELVMG